MEEINDVKPQPWIVGMYQNRLNPKECKLALRTLLSVSDLEKLISLAHNSIAPEPGKEGEYVPVQVVSEVRIPMGPGLLLPIEISLEVHDQDKVSVGQTLYGYAKSQVERKEGEIIKPESSIIKP